MRFPSASIAEWQHIEGMKRDDAVETVIISLRGMNRLRAANFLCGFAHKAQRALYVMLLHNGLCGQ